MREPLDLLLSLVRDEDKYIVILFDGLDRLIGPDKFWAVAYQDLRLLKQLQVSVISTAPISVLYGPGRSVSEHFDKVHHLPPVFTSEPNQMLFLSSLLKRRSTKSLYGESRGSTSLLIFRWSLRDLITLARDAGEEAYLAGRDQIDMEQVLNAVDQLGTSYLRGLGPPQIKSLRLLDKLKSFNLENSQNMELLVTRRVLEYSSTEFVVHPALLRVLPEGDASPNA